MSSFSNFSISFFSSYIGPTGTFYSCSHDTCKNKNVPTTAEHTQQAEPEGCSGACSPDNNEKPNKCYQQTAHSSAGRDSLARESEMQLHRSASESPVELLEEPGSQSSKEATKQVAGAPLTPHRSLFSPSEDHFN